MRRPRYSNIREFKKGRKRTKGQIEKYKEKLKDYRSYTKIKTREKDRLTKLLVSTREKIKGKSRKQIKNIWSTYNDRKSKIKVAYSEKTLRFSPTGINYVKQTTKVFTKERIYTLSMENPDKSIKDFIMGVIDNKKLRYFLIILIGENTETGEEVIIPDAFSRIELLDRIKYSDIDNLYTELMATMSYRPTKSGENFELKKIQIKLTYDK